MGSKAFSEQAQIAHAHAHEGSPCNGRRTAHSSRRGARRQPVLRVYAVPGGSHPHDVAPAPDGEGRGPAMRECPALSYEAPRFRVAAARRSATHAFRLLPALWAAVLMER